MTRTTLKALWFGGGGILATWLAVSPNPPAPASSQTSAVQAPASAAQPTAEQITEQALRLRDRGSEVELQPSTRNPFRFNSRKPADSGHIAQERDIDQANAAAAAPAAPPPPAVTLSGVAQKGGRRTAIITIEGQIYLVGDGDSLAGRYTVVKVDPETVLIRDAAGAEQRLILR